ncbi:MAG TPA: hypothetical protein VGM50_22785 [Gemmatimonadaceae bacterium]
MTHAVGAQAAPPIVALPNATAVSTATFGTIVSVRELPGGRLLVNDGRRRQITMLDAKLGTPAVVMDSTAGMSNFYGPQAVVMIPYLGDSTLVPSFERQTVSVIDPHGQVIRALAMPQHISLGMIKRSATDNTGRIIYMGTPETTRQPANGGIPPAMADSTPLLRADLAKRQVDTVGYFGRPLERTDARRANGLILSLFRPSPLQPMDEWTVLSNGSIAVVRGHDYHIDWIRADGARSSSPKMTFDWRQLTDAEKRAAIDSSRSQFLSSVRNTTFLLSVTDQINWRRELADVPGKLPANVQRVRIDADTSGGMYVRGVSDPVMILPSSPLTVDDVFDYYAPLRAGSVLADLNDRVWILPTRSNLSKAGELVYDVVSDKGGVVENVRAPLGRYIVGFGRDGTVYLASGSINGGFTLERTTLPAQ